MLASGGHVRIGSYDYMLDEGTPEHYIHTFEFPIAEEVEIQGEPGSKTVRRRRLFWSMTDWTGGEGMRTWDPDAANAYSYSQVANTRIVGQFTGRPKRASTTVNASTDDGDQRPSFAVGGGALWIAGGEKVFKTEDYGGSWSAQGTNRIDASDKVTAVCGDDVGIYYASGNGSNREISRYASADSAATALLTREAGKRFIGLGVLNGRLYSWTGAKLFEYDIETAGALTVDDTYRKVYDSGVDLSDGQYGGSGSNHWWGELRVGQNSVFVFLGSEGHTTVYEYKKGRGYPLWNLPAGFTGKSLLVQNGVLYCAGTFSGDGTTNGYGGLYALKLKNREEIFVGYFRKHLNDANRQMQEMANGHGYQILISAAIRGEIWIYDAEADGISMLDSYQTYAPVGAASSAAYDSNAKIGDMVTFGNYRFVVHYTPNTGGGDEYYIEKYQDDEEANRETVGTKSDIVYSAAHTYGFPMDAKNLIGFHISYKTEDSTTSGLVAGQTIDVAYRLDNGSWVDSAQQITSATTPTDVKGRKFIPIATSSSQVKFFRLEVRLTIGSSNGVKDPIVYGVVAEAELLPRNETWQLTLRVKDEPDSNARPITRRWLGSQIRDYLEDLVQNKSVVTFLDGYRYKQNKSYTTHSVTVEDWKDVIDRKGEGSIQVQLRSVDNS